MHECIYLVMQHLLITASVFIVFDSLICFHFHDLGHFGITLRALGSLWNRLGVTFGP